MFNNLAFVRCVHWSKALLRSLACPFTFCAAIVNIRCNICSNIVRVVQILKYLYISLSDETSQAAKIV